MTEQLTDHLRVVSYSTEIIRLSALLQTVPDWDLPSASKPRDEYIHEHQNRGDELRRRTQRGGALAQLAIRRIRQLRLAAMTPAPNEVPLGGSRGEADASQTTLNLGDASTSGPDFGMPTPPLHRTAFVLRSLKHPGEAAVLRNVYGDRCVLLAAHLPREETIEKLALKIARSRDEEKGPVHKARAEDIYEREADPERDVKSAELKLREDQEDVLNEFGQDVRGAYELADYFVDATSRQTIADDVERLVKLVFRAPFETPTPEEVAMSLASAVAASSSAMGRQVGAVVMGRARGEILAVGTNEVPKAGGGQYWTGDVPDGRDFAFDDHADSSVMMRRSMVSEILKLLRREGVIPAAPEDGENLPVDELLRALRTARLSKLVEFGRPVHAEMMAITDAARRGIPLEGAVVVCTTYPCHACARHIVAAGLDEVVYIEPFAKSLAQNLHSDSIVRDRRRYGDKRVLFRQFLGVAPSLYGPFFRRERSERRDEHGVALKYAPASARPRVNDNALAYQFSEWAAVQAIERAMRQDGLIPKDEQGYEDDENQANAESSDSDTST